MLDGVLRRLLPLGLGMRTAARPGDGDARTATISTGGVWTLHSMLIETMLDLAGLEYDAVARRIVLDPALPSAWAHTGLTEIFPCGEVSYRLDRPIGGTVHHLVLKARLRHPVVVDVRITSLGLTELGPWQSSPPGPAPAFDPRTGRLAWSFELPAGESSWNWTWG